jgi:hypothetical protein
LLLYDINEGKKKKEEEEKERKKTWQEAFKNRIILKKTHQLHTWGV